MIIKTNDDSSDNANGLPDTKYYKDACITTGFSQKRLSTVASNSYTIVDIDRPDGT